MEKYARYVEMNGMGILYEIANSLDNDLETRYAATRTMQGLKEKREKLSDFELNVYIGFLKYGTEQLAHRLDMRKDQIQQAMRRIRIKGYEV